MEKRNSIKSMFNSICNAGIDNTTFQETDKYIWRTNVFSISLVIFTVPYMLFFWIKVKPILGIILLVLITMYLCVPLLNRMKKYTFSRILIIFIGNTAIFIYALLLGKPSNIHLLFFFVAAYSFFLFARTEKIKFFLGLIINIAAIVAFFTYYSFNDISPIVFKESVYKVLELCFYATTYIVLILELFYLYHSNNKAEEDLKEATTQLVQAEKLNALGELTAGISHELNQPLNVIKMANQLAIKDLDKNKIDEKKFKDRFNDIKQEVNKMSEIINHMRIFTRRSDGSLNEKIDLNLLLQSSLKFFREQFKIHSIELEEELENNLPQITGDSIRLEQVIINLVTNARKALVEDKKSESHVIIRTYTLDAQLSRLKKESVVLEVQDNGHGVPEHLGNKVFEPFFTTKLPNEGTGLGLSISKKIIEEHNGEIKLENNIGQGATFLITLPVRGTNG